MKKYLLLLLVAGSLGQLTAQYHRIAKPGRVWYSLYGLGQSISTEVLAVEGDTTISGTTYPLLVQKDSSLVTTDTIAYLVEDTLAGTLRIHFFDRPALATGQEVLYDFSLTKSDTAAYDTSGYGQNIVVVDSTYTITDFRGVQRKVIELTGADPHSCTVPYAPWVEGLGAGVLWYHVPDCYNAHAYYAQLKCVFDDTVKIYGDTVQQCFRQKKIGLAQHELQNIGLFPNPASTVLHISSKVPLEQLRIYNLQGSLLRKETDLGERISVIDLPAGMYIIEIRDRDSLHITKKFWKN